MSTQREAEAAKRRVDDFGDLLPNAADQKLDGASIAALMAMTRLEQALSS